MLLSDFDYHLPKELIAQTPIEPRDHSRLMVIHRDTGKIEHRHFYDLPDILPENTLLVCNNTKVFKARLFGKLLEKEVNISEVFLLSKTGETKNPLTPFAKGGEMWQCMVSPGRKFFPGKTITFIPSPPTPLPQDGRREQDVFSLSRNAGEGGRRPGEGKFSAKVISIKNDGTRVLEFNQEVEPKLEEYGHIPLPPYIKQEAPLARYQTVYAKESGSVAAPTAGLHFTPELFENLRKKGIEKTEVTLHVGRGTFEPVKVDKIEDHVMHHEIYQVSEETAKMINDAKSAGKKILAVGTTSVRTLETCAEKDGSIKAQAGHTNLFITPGYQYKCVDILLTNFHLPKSTLLMLVAAFCGKDLMFRAYEEAIKEQYRFFSFGDAMVIL